jgi:hypothetical protein
MVTHLGSISNKEIVSMSSTAKQPVTARRHALVSGAEMDQRRRLLGAIVTAQKLPTITAAAKRQLIDDLLHAAGFAQVGQRGLEPGKRSRPAARTLDFLYRDVCDALTRAGISYSMNQDPTQGRAQALCIAIAEAFELPAHDARGSGSMFAQAQRASKIAKQPAAAPAERVAGRRRGGAAVGLVSFSGRAHLRTNDPIAAGAFGPIGTRPRLLRGPT